jgi:hypothetical protein
VNGEKTNYLMMVVSSSNILKKLCRMMLRKGVHVGHNVN